MGWGRTQTEEALTAREAFGRLTLDDLRPLAGLVAADPPKRKSELAPLLAKVMTDPARVRDLYAGLGAPAQRAVRVAAFDPAGRLDREKFRAWFGEDPRFDTADPNRESWEYRYEERRQVRPTPLRLFFPRFDHLPTDTRLILRGFVPPPEAFSVPTVDAPPPTHTLFEHVWSDRQRARREWEEPVRVRETAAAAEADLRAVLRLVEAGKVRVTDKKLVPTEATRRALAGVLAGGDFYTPDDADDSKYDPAFDLGVRSFAWPVVLQAGGLAGKSGDALRLTAAGKKALTAAPPDVLRKLWAAWLRTRAFDEFARVDAIKGQGRARMSAAANRRAVVVDGLSACPVGRWFAVDDFFRLLRATGRSFAVAHEVWELYIAEHEYGSLGYEDRGAWEQLQGRFVLAFLFEYAATLGLVDVAFLPPQGVRHDFRDRWGADDFTCLSRYDGLLFVRVNPLGAWLLGLADGYRPAAPARADVLRVLANLDVVATPDLPPADRLVLGRFADPASEGAWRLSAAKVLGVVEQGGSVDELEQFLWSRTTADLPATVVRFLADLRAKAGRLADAGPARLIACADGHVAAELAADRQLEGKCLRAGDRFVVVRDADLAAVRKAARKLGYVWPVPGD
ncbi:MAG: hypothetical protein C0501_22305 [Isosphaera sp.]|nr:hypothetical protein [Isosphaera sp.]